MAYTVRKARSAEDLQAVAELDARIFETDRRIQLGRAAWWLVRDGAGSPVGFAGISWVRGGRRWMLARAGVLPEHRRQGLHRRLLRARERHARRLASWAPIVTYTAATNTGSANSLLSAGYRVVNLQATQGGHWLNFRKDGR